eukprot:m.370436 g.370436  ORF g.370436 m.370436 type:complete len:84 (-) comp56128_c0_seq2:988-1239(-)
MDKLSSFAAAVARSPGAVRRALASPGTLRRVFGAKEYAALDDTTNQDNGFSVSHMHFTLTFHNHQTHSIFLVVSFRSYPVLVV